MKIERVHAFDTLDADGLGALRELQRELSARVRIDGRDVLTAAEVDAVETVAGADVSYNRGSSRFFAAVVVLRLPGLEVVEQVWAEVEVTFPYVPGYLSFRELPVLLAAFERLERAPDVAVIDGHGIAHPRGLGIAAHGGLFLGVPTVGCAKKRLTGSVQEPGPTPGDASPILIGGEKVGVALRTRRRASPVLVSPGHLITVDAAEALIRRCLAGYRLPEPTRRAHEAVNAVRRQRTKA